ncbi:hypothetical protein C8Q70DRAFT_975994 [Cubamyces menziesii]|uniref:Uncharacterized protein n=1 Tax=Trametes cubensis TaxID=1111947 RepID=A0AAD7X6G3_9APHY|nr:hypothetical protein C8Q70DRAFT_975994 [Cubamyces menziesii]KAJ8463265.1 hypothetical protein ONZ51_g10363 [Trametes cubensis]
MDSTDNMQPSGRSARPQSWNALHALECLTPPSPSPSGSLGAIAALASLGDIPIFLHTSDDSVPQDLNHICSRPDGSQGGFLAPSVSTTTVHSTNTFGLPSGPHSDVYAHDSLATSTASFSSTVTPDDASDRTVRPRPTCSPNQDPSYLSTIRPSRSGGYFSNRFASISDLSRFTISAYMDTWSSSDNLAMASPDMLYPSESSAARKSVSPSASITVSATATLNPSSNPVSPSPSGSPLYHAVDFTSTDSMTRNIPSHLAPPPSRSWSTISSVLFSRRPMSPSPSITSTLASAENSPNKTRLRFPRKKPREPSAQLHLDHRVDGAASSSLKPSTTSPLLAPLSDKHPCPLLLRDIPGMSMSRSSGSSSGLGSGSLTDLPDVLSWLRDLCIELWIDQEGFRAIRPRFRLSGYTHPASTTRSGSTLADVLTHGTAQFLPARRQGAVYHHGTLDSCPVLRRLTLADNEDKDYISRHASLTIKANGVYAVTGTETFDDHPSQSGSLQLHWRFEYVVDDPKGLRRATTSGEKAFIPLSFSCSPGLLHPTHGKPIKLMHVLKKNITPKLSAKPADIRLGHVADVAPLSDANGTQGEPTQGARRARALSTHRRTRSSDPPSNPTWPSATCPEPEPARKTRPASVSAAPISSPPHTGLGERPRQAYDGVGACSAAPPGSRLPMHIMSVEELTQILGRIPTPERPRATVDSGALSPPSYYRHRRRPSEMERVDELGMAR